MPVSAGSPVSHTVDRRCKHDSSVCWMVGRSPDFAITIALGTYVIGYDTGEWVEVLDRMAAAGDTGRSMHFPVGDQASLESALRAVAGSVVSCTYELVPPGDVHYVRVTVDGVDVRARVGAE